MNSELTDLRACFTTTAREIHTLAFITRDSELQNAALERARALLVLIDDRKAEAVEADDELSANELLLMELAAVAITEQLEMCVSLKQDAPEAAWDHLVRAQAACEAALRV